MKRDIYRPGFYVDQSSGYWHHHAQQRRSTMHKRLLIALTVWIAVLTPAMLAASRAAADEQLWQAICMVESSNNPKAHHKGEDSRGIVQIRAIMVRDVNRILGEDRYTHDDAWSVVKSREMWDIYHDHYGHTTREAKARAWNSGPGWRKKIRATDGYWAKIQRELAK